MTTATMEQRVETLERRLDAVQRMLDEALTQPTMKRQGWPAIVGTFEDDPLYEEAMRLGRDWRDSQVDGSAEAAT